MTPIINVTDRERDLTAEREEYKTHAQQLMTTLLERTAERDALKADAMRLDWLDAGFEPPFVAAPQPAAYAPLTDDVLNDLWRQVVDANPTAGNAHLRFYRAIEQAVRGKT